MATHCAPTFRLFKFIQTSHFLPKLMLNSSLIKIDTLASIVPRQNIRAFSEDEEYKPTHRFGTPEVARKKTVPIQKVLLLSEEGKIIQELAIEQAQQMAKRRNLNLVQVVDLGLKTVLPIYQLMSKVQFVNEERKAKYQKKLEKSTTVKSAKLLIISSKIDKHDLQTKINKMIKLLQKNNKVQVFVSTDGNKLALEEVVKIIETETAASGKMKNIAPKSTGKKLYLEPIIPEPAATKEKDSS